MKNASSIFAKTNINETPKRLLETSLFLRLFIHESL